jgi:hypothetical protein
MASADEHRATIDVSRDALRDALIGAATNWEDAPGDADSDDEEDWSPRQVAEHAIRAERGFAGMIATALQREGPGWDELSLATAEEALAALGAAIIDANKVLSGLTDEDLNVEARQIADYPPTVEGIVQLASGHLDDHAKQIAAAGA